MDISQIPLDPQIVTRIIETLLILLAALILTQIGQRVALHTFDDQERQYRASKYLSRVLWGLALILIVALWSPSASTMITVLTIIGAGLAVALRDVLLSFVGWIHLSLHPPYRQGDRIEMNGVRGDVVDVGLLQTTLLEIGEWVDASQNTGRLAHLPNAWIYQHGVKNYTEGFGYLWFEQSLVVTFDSNWRTARQLILDAVEAHAPNVESEARNQLRQMSSEYLVQMNVLTPFVYVEVDAHGVKLTLRLLTPARGRRNIRNDILMDVLDRFQEHDDVALAYPTYGVAPATRQGVHAHQVGSSATAPRQENSPPEQRS